MKTITDLTLKKFSTPLRHCIVAAAFIGICATRGAAQDMHAHQRPEAATQNDPGALIKIVHDATERFKNVSVAIAEGYVLQFGCVSGPDSGAMGLHYVNGDLVNRGILDPTRPQIVIY